MKSIVSTLACAALLAAPLAAGPSLASAQTHQGGSHAAAGAGPRGGFAGAGSRGGFSGRGFGGGHFHGGFYGAPFFFGGAFLGFALADSWYYDYPAYYGYYAPYGVAPPPYAGYDYDEGPPPPSQAEPPRACGQWSWDAAHSKYNWIPCANGPGA